MSFRATKAIVRGVSRSYDVYSRPHAPISVERAAKQHALYLDALRSTGLQLVVVPADHDKPDCVFVEDTAVVWENQSLICRLNPSRDGEKAVVADLLRKTHRVHVVTAPGALEGGDVLHTDDLTYVGISTRTNEEGAEQLARFLAPFGRKVINVPVTRCLHLKTGATYLGNATMLVAPNLIEAGCFAGSRILETALGEDGAANILHLPGSLAIAAGYPSTEHRLRDFAAERGLQTIRLDVSEFAKADGSLTCLSIIW